MSRFVALLRGINVGGKNIIKMADLRGCLEDQGFSNVRTYIQSGNVVFEAGKASRAKVAPRIERALAGAFDYRLPVVLRTRPELRKIVDRAPRGFGARPQTFRYDVIFLKEPLTARTAMKSVETKPGVDTANVGPKALYFSRLIKKASSSRLSRLTSQPAYQNMTIRNWNTTTKLLEMIESA